MLGIIEAPPQKRERGVGGKGNFFVLLCFFSSRFPFQKVSFQSFGKTFPKWKVSSFTREEEPTTHPNIISYSSQLFILKIHACYKSIAYYMLINCKNKVYNLL